MFNSQLKQKMGASHQLSFCRNIHSSDECWAVMAAKNLIQKGIDPVGHSLLSTMPT